MAKPHCSTSENDTTTHKLPRFIGMFQTPGANVPAYTRVSISNEMKEWIEATNLKFEHLYQQINLLQEQVQKSSLGFPSAISSNTYRVKPDSAAENSSSGIEINPNPPKLCEEAALPDLNSVDINALVELLSTCSQLVCAVESLYPYPDLQARSGISAIDLRKRITDMIHALTYQWKPYTQRDDK